MANKKNQSKVYKAENTKIGNGILYNKEGKSLYFPMEKRHALSEDAAIFIKEALSTSKENETYAVTITVTKIK
jgi:hypothetical protein